MQSPEKARSSSAGLSIMSSKKMPPAGKDGVLTAALGDRSLWNKTAFELCDLDVLEAAAVQA